MLQGVRECRQPGFAWPHNTFLGKIMRHSHCWQINVARLFVSRTFGYWYTVTLGLSARCFPSVSSVNAVRVCTASCEGTPLFDYGNELCELRRWTAILVSNSVKHNYNTCLFPFLSGVPVHARNNYSEWLSRVPGEGHS